MKYTKDIENISSWIKDKVGDKRIILGVSGGIDSAVVLALSVKAVGVDKVTAVVLPCISDPEDAKDAYLVMSQFPGIDVIQFPLDDIFVSVMDTYDFMLIEDDFEKDAPLTNLTKGNLKSRLRMVALYMFANQYDGYVMGTTNKTEMMIGFFTKYGDGGIDFEPIADYYKTEIWEMAEELRIPKKIIRKSPNAGLGISKTDEEELGMSYEEIDDFLIWRNIGIPYWRNEKEFKLASRLLGSIHKQKMPPSYKKEK